MTSYREERVFDGPTGGAETEGVGCLVPAIISLLVLALLLSALNHVLGDEDGAGALDRADGTESRSD